MKQLDFDRAFPQTPDCVHAAIEMGFRKGQKQMKMRNKIISMGSIAAAVVILIAVAALAAGGLGGAPKPDILAQPPVTDVPKASEKAIRVYSTDGAAYYHLEPDCSGMENALEMSEIEAVRMGKKACLVCIPLTCNGHSGEEIEYVYYSQGAKYFHKQEECGGGSFDLKGEYFTVTRAFPGKEPCATCFPNGIEECVHERAFVVEVEPTAAPAPEEHTAVNESTTDSMPEAEEYVPVNAKEKASQADADVYYTENGKYYHSNEYCQGMMNADTHTREEARESRKLPCPLCLLVYAREGGSYFHLLPDCMGMLYADLYTQDEANAMGNQRCPLCLSPGTVYATKLGKYFHADKYCSGMQGASATTPIAEWDNGKLPCPVCIAANAYENEEEAIVYAAYGKPRYYHKVQVCNGQENKRELTLAQADKENLDPCPDCYVTAEAAAATDVSTTAAPDIDANLSFLGTITQLDRLYQAAFGNLEEAIAAAYGFMPENAENSWILTNGQQTVLSLSFQDTGNDSALEAKWIFDIMLNPDREISNRFMESIRNSPMSSMYSMAIDAARNHMKELHPGNAEALDPYVSAIRIEFDEAYQIKNCRIQFPCAMHALYVEYQPEEREDGSWSWEEKTYTETV